MVTWLIQPTKIEQDKIDSLIAMLEQAEIEYHLIYPLQGKILLADKSEFVFEGNKEYFVCGSYPLTRYAHAQRPDSVFSLEQYDFQDFWDIFGKENFVNHDAIICNANQINWDKQEEYFVRPLEDTKAFNGGIYNKHTLKYDGLVVSATLKHVSREYRFFIIDDKIVSASLYKVNGSLEESPIIDPQATCFVEEMKSKFTQAGYVLDVALIDDEFKIMELNCLNAAGFYQINLYKLIMAVQDHYENKKTLKMNI